VKRNIEDENRKEIIEKRIR